MMAMRSSPEEVNWRSRNPAEITACDTGRPQGIDDDACDCRLIGRRDARCERDESASSHNYQSAQ